MDEVDKKILAQLQQDGRKTLQDLAEATGFTSMGTKKRLEKLQKNGTIKNFCFSKSRFIENSYSHSNVGNGKFPSDATTA